MNDPAPFDVVLSLRGHDRGKLFQVVAAEKDRVLLCDGKNRRIDNPKSKSPRHVRVAVKCASAPATDREIRTTLARTAKAAAKEERSLGER